MIRNHFSNDINDRILNIVGDIMPMIKDKYKCFNKTGRDWQYNLSKEYLDEIQNPLNVSGDKYFFKFNKALVRDSLVPLIQELYPNKKIRTSAHYHYPDKGYMGWHTNCKRPCRRMYITYASEDKKSFFRYLKDGEVITDYDDKGITIREFDIPKPPDYFWHCVGSECDRYTFGFRIKESDLNSSSK